MHEISILFRISYFVQILKKILVLRISLFPAISLFQPISKQEKCITNSHLSSSRIHTTHCIKIPIFHYHKHCPISCQTMILYLSAKLCKICYLNSIFMRNFVQIQWIFWINAQFRANLVSYWYVIDAKFVQKKWNCSARENTVLWETVVLILPLYILPLYILPLYILPLYNSLIFFCNPLAQ